MSIVKFAAPVAGLRGTIGGLTYSANKSGPYARQWSRGANRRTTPQTDNRADLATLAAYWRTLDPADRLNWDTFAADPAQELTNPLGEAYYISGFLWFVRMSRWLLTCGRDLIESAPALGVPPAPTVSSLQVSAGAAASQITYPASEFGPDYDCIIELNLSTSVGTYAPSIPPVLIGGFQIPGASPLDFSPELAPPYPLIQVGQRAFAHVYRQSSEGYRSSPTSAAADVVA